MESVPPYWVDVARMFRMRAADPDTEPELVFARSPLYHAASIRIPLLIAQGANDPRVKRSESEQIVAVLEQNNVPHTYMLFDDEGHGFVKPENNERFRAAVEAFLGAHLGGRIQPSGMD
jgi:dipeptidyl aminopeptidase/acylaminoacyl peptidase